MTSDTDEHQLKLRMLRAKLSNISNDFHGELSDNKRHERQYKDNSYKNPNIHSLHQKPIQTNTSFVPTSTEPKQLSTQESHTIAPKEHPVFQENSKLKNYDFVSDEKIFQKTKPNWESWKCIPRENLDRLKKKTLGRIFKNNN